MREKATKNCENCSGNGYCDLQRQAQIFEHIQIVEDCEAWTPEDD